MPSKTITTATLLKLASGDLMALRQRADAHLLRAIAAAGSEAALIQSRVLDELATEAANSWGLEQACSVAGDHEAAAAISAARFETSSAIGNHAYTARMVSIPGWCWVTRTFKPATTATAQVPA